MYTGVDFCKRLCGVSVIRRYLLHYFTVSFLFEAVSLLSFMFMVFYSGESMENALRACCNGIKIGKILIHRENNDGRQVCFSSLRIRFLTHLSSQWFEWFFRAVDIWEVTKRHRKQTCLPPWPCSSFRFVVIPTQKDKNKGYNIQCLTFKSVLNRKLCSEGYIFAYQQGSSRITYHLSQPYSSKQPTKQNLLSTFPHSCYLLMQE